MLLLFNEAKPIDEQNITQFKQQVAGHNHKSKQPTMGEQILQ